MNNKYKATLINHKHLGKRPLKTSDSGQGRSRTERHKHAQEKSTWENRNTGMDPQEYIKVTHTKEETKNNKKYIYQ